MSGLSVTTPWRLASHRPDRQAAFHRLLPLLAFVQALESTSLGRPADCVGLVCSLEPICIRNEAADRHHHTRVAKREREL